MRWPDLKITYARDCLATINIKAEKKCRLLQFSNGTRINNVFTSLLLHDSIIRRVMVEVLERQVERLTGHIANETDGDKAAESLLSLLGLLKNGKSTNKVVPEKLSVTFSCCSER